jgi:diguanylate cyclase (GGDEF)-like protein
MSARLAPGWLDFALLAALYCAGAELGTLTTVPEGMAIVRPQNAVVLAMLLRFDGARLPVVAAVVVAASVVVDAMTVGPLGAAVFGLVNFGEAAAAFFLLKYLRFDARFREIDDVWRFLLGAPLVPAMGAALCGAAAYVAFHGGDRSYFDIVREWWFGDALGLTVLTPLLLAFPPFGAAPARRAFRRADAWLLAAAGLLAAVILLDVVHVVALVPLVLYVGARYTPRWAALAVAFSVAVIVLAIKQGLQPFGDVPERDAVLVAQRLIFVLTVMGLGFSTLISRMREQQAELAARVAERTAELERANAELGRLAHVDSLTGVANRRLFDETLPAEIAHAARHGSALSLVLADIDHFKQVNDMHGHAAGDEVIQAVGRTLRDCARGRDLVARYGGEEFAVLLPQTDLAHAMLFAERVRTTLAQAQLPRGVRVTASLGVAQLRPGCDAAELLAASDAALYRAKNAGRDRVEAGVAEPAAERRVRNS